MAVRTKKVSQAELKRNAKFLREKLLKQLLSKEITQEEAGKKIGAINRAEQRGEELPNV